MTTKNKTAATAEAPAAATTPAEQLTAEQQELQSLRLKNAELEERIKLISAEARAEGNKPAMPADPVFELDGKKYRVLLPAVEIPRLGIRTAEQILVDRDAQAALVKVNSSVIKHEL